MSPTTVSRASSSALVRSAVAIVLAFAATAVAQPIELASCRSLPLEDLENREAFWVESLAVGDVDEDGHLDVVVPDALESATKVFFGHGDGTFAKSELGGGARDVELVDIDGDGHLDLLRAAAYALSVRLGAGTRAFGGDRLFSYDFGRRAVDLELADFDHDGTVDAAVACGFTASVAILLGDGEGGFSLVGNFDVGSDPGGLAIADFDRDGNPDFAASLLDADSIRIRFGDGTGLFPERRTIHVGDRPRQVAARDVDGDGSADLLVSSDSEDTVTILFGDGTGAFPTTRSLPVPNARGLHFDDIDRDGEEDMLATTDVTLALLSGEGAGEFAACRIFGTWASQRAVAFGDFDEDGRRDLATASGNALSFHFGDGLGGFPYSPVRDSDGEAIAVADLNGDAHLDVVAGHVANPGLAIHFGDGTGELGSPPATFDVPAWVVDVLALDVDLDGAIDVASCFSDHSGIADAFGVAVRLGDGAGGFATSFEIDLPGSVSGLATADFDRDGRPDFVTVERGSDDIAILLGAGDGSLVRGAVIGTDDLPTGVLAADFDGDGNDDLAVHHGSNTGRTIRIYRGDGLGGAASSLVLTRPRPVAGTAVADVNEDGILDLLSAESDSRFDGTAGGVAVFLGDGVGGFSGPSYFPSGCEAESVIAADLDLDGHLDLVVAHSGSRDVGILHGDGLGSFLPPRGFGVDGGSRIAIGDFDEDGVPDVVSGRRGVTILRNRTFDPIDAFPGNVNAAAGPITNVLFVNGQRGDGVDRRLVVDRNALFVLRMKAPPALPTAAFALFAWIGESRNWTIAALPNGYGKTVIPALPNGGRPKRVWNNTGEASFGVPQLPSTAAPSIVLRRESGVRKRITFTLQGIIEDPASPSGVYAVTNAITVESR